MIKIEFDPSQIAYSDLLIVFFATHDPTTLNRQGNDVGPQYRSIILYTNDDQKRAAEAFIQELDESKTTEGRVITEIQPLDIFYEAEAYHRKYYLNNQNQPYCQLVIVPKVAKLRKSHFERLKS